MITDLACVLALAAFISTAFCLASGRTDAEAWRVPVGYRGDAAFVLAHIKAVREGHASVWMLRPILDLNAPFGANWADYPKPEKVLFWGAGVASRWIDLFVVANLLVLLAHVMAGVSLFGVARELRCPRPWALLGGAAFGLSPYLFFRGLQHLTLSFYWHIPLCILVLGWCISRRGPSRRRLLGSCAVAVVTGFHNIYYAAMFVQFLGLAAISQAARRQGRRAVGWPLLLAAVTVVVVALVNADLVIHAWQNGPNPGAIVRSMATLERYAMRPIELALFPPYHPLAESFELGRYWNGKADEEVSSYLGLVGVAALIRLLLPGVVSALRGRPVVLSPAQGGALWILSFAVVGGLNAVAGTLGFVFLRGANRYSIWLLALALMSAGRALAVPKASRRRVAWPAAAGLAAVVLVDQVPRPPTSEAIATLNDRIGDYRLLVATREDELAPRSMIFQLPVMDFPENGTVRRVRDHDHFLPFLFSTHLRFTYGTDKGRPEPHWQREVAALRLEEMVGSLESSGFAGVLVDTRGYQDRAAGLIRSLEGMGRPVTARRGPLVFVRLHPGAGSRVGGGLRGVETLAPRHVEQGRGTLAALGKGAPQG